MKFAEASVWITHEGMLPSRVVLYRTDRDWVVHTQVDHGDGKRSYCNGSYCGDITDAVEEFKRRCIALEVPVPGLHTSSTCGSLEVNG